VRGRPLGLRRYLAATSCGIASVFPAEFGGDWEHGATHEQTRDMKLRPNQPQRVVGLASALLVELGGDQESRSPHI
jgi:hypothetical protein